MRRQQVVLTAAGGAVVVLVLVLVAVLRPDGSPADGSTDVAQPGDLPSSVESPAPGGTGFLGGAGASRPPAAGPSRSKPAGQPERPAPPDSSWPGAGDTGVPAGVQLSDYKGSLDLTKSGTVLDRKHIKGCLDVKAKNVTIRRSKIECNDQLVKLSNDASLTIEDSELDGQGTAFAIGEDNYTLRRVNIHNINEGPRIGDHVVIQDSWIHDLVRTDPDDHQDILQTTGGEGSVIKHNTLDASAKTGQFNAAFQVGAELAPELADLVCEDNLMGGGGYTVNFRGDENTRNVVFRNNTFQRTSVWGAVVRQDSPGITWDSSNVWQDTGEPVDE